MTSASTQPTWSEFHQNLLDVWIDSVTKGNPFGEYYRRTRWAPPTERDQLLELLTQRLRDVVAKINDPLAPKPSSQTVTATTNTDAVAVKGSGRETLVEMSTEQHLATVKTESVAQSNHHQISSSAESAGNMQMPSSAAWGSMSLADKLRIAKAMQVTATKQPTVDLLDGTEADVATRQVDKRPREEDSSDTNEREGSAIDEPLRRRAITFDDDDDDDDDTFDVFVPPQPIDTNGGSLSTSSSSSIRPSSPADELSQIYGDAVYDISAAISRITGGASDVSETSTRDGPMDPSKMTKDEFMRNIKRAPRRGEIGITAEQVAEVERQGYVMSASRNRAADKHLDRIQRQLHEKQAAGKHLEFLKENDRRAKERALRDLADIARSEAMTTHDTIPESKPSQAHLPVSASATTSNQLKGPDADGIKGELKREVAPP